MDLTGITKLRLGCFQVLDPDGNRSGHLMRQINSGQNVSYGSTAWFTCTPYETPLEGGEANHLGFEQCAERGLLWQIKWIIWNKAMGTTLELWPKRIFEDWREAVWETTGNIGDGLSLRHAPWAYSRGFNMVFEFHEDYQGGRIALQAELGGKLQSPIREFGVS